MMDDIEAALERYEKVLWQAVPPKWEDCLARIDLLRTLHREALSTIRQALREADAQLELAKDIAGEYRRRMMAAENRIEKLEAARCPRCGEWVRDFPALSTPSEEPKEKEPEEHPHGFLEGSWD